MFDTESDAPTGVLEPPIDEIWPEIPADYLWDLTVAAYGGAEPRSRVCDLDTIEPGPTLLATLSAIDVESLSDHDRVTVLRAWARMTAHAQSQMYRSMAAISDAYGDLLDDPTLTEPAAAAEIRAALRLTRRAADSELSQALDLRSRLPRVWEAMTRGLVDRRRAWVFLRQTDHLTTALAREVTDPLVDEAHRLTTGQLSERLRRRCADADPADAMTRYRNAVETRRVVSESQPDGTITLTAFELPAVRAAEAMERVNRLAREARTADETRTMDQLRADVLLDLLCGTDAPRKGSVHLTVDLATLAELSEHSGDLAGYGPVVAEIARQTTRAMREAAWSVSVVDDATGRHVVDGTVRRRPGAAQRRRIAHRQPVCRFPGCRMPSVESDLDHRTPYSDGGETTDDNLAPLCRHDHCIRHQTGWSYRPLPDGDHVWTSPFGHEYTTSGRDP